MRNIDCLIIGAGLSGAVVARELTDKGLKCLVVERRKHVGGNARDKKISGINVHLYGPHIFHTDNERVWKYVNRFGRFNNFVNSPLANYKNEIYNLPFNMNTFRQIYGRDCITPADAKRFISEDIVSCEVPTNLEEFALSVVGRQIYEKLIKGYTEKQWEKDCRELRPEIIKRIPLRFTYDNNYFWSMFQGIPISGYSELVKRLLDGVEVLTGCECTCLRERWLKTAKNVVLTGAIDEYYNYCYGALEYRSLKFEHEELNVKNYQGNAVINYTSSDIPFTRVIEHKHFSGVDVPTTIITREYPQKWQVGADRFYPVNDEKNDLLYRNYKKLAEQDNLITVGRLSEFKYLNMDEAIENALKVAESICEKQ